MNKKMGILVASLSVLVIGGTLVLSNIQADDKVAEKSPVENTQGTSAMLEEVLVGEGTIDKIEANEQGAVITVANVKMQVHASTNIFQDEKLLEVSDLKEGQNVKIYSDGVEEDILNGLRVEIAK